MTDAPDEFVGRTIGGCRVIERIGRGAMAAVYRAEQISLDRTVALKLLDDRSAGDAGALPRFFREARSAARLVHPNVVQVYDVGIDQGVPYIIMEYVEGETLYDRLQRDGRVPATEALEIARQAALALLRAQEFGIVHRDVKPANIMISRRGEVKLADFGLAKAAKDTGITRSGPAGALGTPYYMAPEQADGSPLDVRCDIYGLGATLYHVVTGHPPFKGSSTAAILLAHATEKPVPACVREKSVPRAVSDLIDKMMAKRAGDRYASARALLAGVAGVKRAFAEGAGNRPKPRTDLHLAVGVTDRRAYRRIAADLVTDMTVVTGPEDRMDAIRSQVKNLSRQGLSVESDKPLPVGSVVRMSMRLGPRSPELHVLGVVRWTSPGPGRPAMGIQFLEVDTTSEEDISRAVGDGERDGRLEELTRTPSHEALLKLHASTQGDALRLGALAAKLGSTRGLLRLVLRPFAEHGLVRLTDEYVEFLAPPDDVLRGAIRRHLEGPAPG
ncbi:MAG: protein kinase domain-containing protein [Planctomycetota bacterium]